jgi:dolichol-phosphate mannosyltransferase
MSAMVVVPTYNERDNIEQLLSELLAYDHELQIVVVDDNSPDGTGAIVDGWSAKEKRVHVLHRPGKLGLGTAYIAGFTYALSQGVDCVLSMDADFSHHPRYIPEMLRKSQEADVVIGSRYVNGGGTLNCTFRRKLLSRVANLVAKLLLGLRARDCTAGFRCYRAHTLENIDYRSIRSNGYSYLIEMLYAVQMHHYTIAEIPILFEDRRLGTSKISSSEITKAMQTVVRLFGKRLGLYADKEQGEISSHKPAVLK